MSQVKLDVLKEWVTEKHVLKAAGYRPAQHRLRLETGLGTLWPDKEKKLFLLN